MKQLWIFLRTRYCNVDVIAKFANDALILFISYKYYGTKTKNFFLYPENDIIVF